jgi:hypothetical protein
MCLSHLSRALLNDKVIQAFIFYKMKSLVTTICLGRNHLTIGKPIIKDRNKSTRREIKIVFSYFGFNSIIYETRIFHIKVGPHTCAR